MCFYCHLYGSLEARLGLLVATLLIGCCMPKTDTSCAGHTNSAKEGSFSLLSVYLSATYRHTMLRLLIGFSWIFYQKCIFVQGGHKWISEVIRYPDLDLGIFEWFFTIVEYRQFTSFADSSISSQQILMKFSRAKILHKQQTIRFWCRSGSRVGSSNFYGIFQLFNGTRLERKKKGDEQRWWNTKSFLWNCSFRVCTISHAPCASICWVVSLNDFIVHGSRMERLKCSRFKLVHCVRPSWDTLRRTGLPPLTRRRLPDADGHRRTAAFVGGVAFVWIYGRGPTYVIRLHVRSSWLKLCAKSCSRGSRVESVNQRESRGICLWETASQRKSAVVVDILLGVVFAVVCVSRNRATETYETSNLYRRWFFFASRIHTPATFSVSVAAFSHASFVAKT